MPALAEAEGRADLNCFASADSPNALREECVPAERSVADVQESGCAGKQAVKARAAWEYLGGLSVRKDQQAI